MSELAITDEVRELVDLILLAAEYAEDNPEQLPAILPLINVACQVLLPPGLATCGEVADVTIKGLN